MKRTLFLLLVLALALSCSMTALASQSQPLNGEITFGGIAFGTSYKDTYDALSSFRGKLSNTQLFTNLSETTLFTPIAAYKDQETSRGKGFPYCRSNNKLCYYAYNTEKFKKDFFVAGYKVEMIFLYFSSVSLTDGTIIRNPNSCQLFAGEYVIEYGKWEHNGYQTKTPFKDAFSAFDDIKGKLSSKYGTPIEFIGNEAFTEGSKSYKSKYDIWLGDNHTGIMIHVAEELSGAATLNITYGRTDMYDLIQVINESDKKNSFGGL